ncbi:MAG TPA: hypothetical protein VHV83_07110 [Armatimonadota bacterium]|nr:hypothetical protein [Armatimonadota bacterium]
MQVDASGGNMVQNMPTVASAPNGQITVAMCVQDAGESNTVTVQPASGSGDKFIYRGQFGLPSIALSRVGESRNFRPLTIPSGANAGNYWLVT